MKFLILLIALLPFDAYAADTIIVPATTANPGAADHMFYQTAALGLAPASVCMTSDGNGHIIPISGGGGSGSLYNLINPTGTFVDNTSIGSSAAVTLTLPANAIGFILEASSSNTANIRWDSGSAATTTSGMRLEPGRDTGYVPLGASVSVIAETGSGQEVQIQWVSNQ